MKILWAFSAGLALMALCVDWIFGIPLCSGKDLWCFQYHFWFPIDLNAIYVSVMVSFVVLIHDFYGKRKLLNYGIIVLAFSLALKFQKHYFDHFCGTLFWCFA